MTSTARSLRDGTWVTRRLVTASAIAVCVWYALEWIYVLSGPGRFDPGGYAVGADFSCLYAGSVALHAGRAVQLYDFEWFRTVVTEYSGKRLFAWFYPPPTLPFYWLLALAPYLVSLSAWLFAGLVGYLTAVERIVHEARLLPLAIAFPCVLQVAIGGQNGLMLAGALGWSLVLLNRAPRLSGALMAAFIIKPHLGALLGLAMVAQRQWKHVRWAGAVTLLLALWATFWFGVEVWPAALRAARLATTVPENGGLVDAGFHRFASVFAAVRLVGGSTAAAYVGQALAASLAVWSVVWCSRTKAGFEFRSAALTFAMLSVSPYLFDLDLVIGGIGLAFFIRGVGAGPWLPWEKTTCFLAWLTPAFVRYVAATAHVPIAPIIVFSMLALSVRRVRLAGGYLTTSPSGRVAKTATAAARQS